MRTLLTSRYPFPLASRMALAALVTLPGIGAVACRDSLATESGPRTSYAAAVRLGEGTARTYVVRDARGTPISLGVEMTEGALKGLPQTVRTMHLPLPAEAAATTQYTFVMLDWNPAGHEPDHVYTVPHFDFHFYMGEEADVMEIPGGPDPVVAESRFVPQDYIAPGNAAVPGMGVHWVDATSGEFNGKTFDQTFIYGYTGGQLLFVEPMITKAFLESAATLFTTPVKEPAAVQRAGFYPKRYSIRHDRERGVYRISIDELTRRG